METVFSRLRRLEATKNLSLHEMIVDACDAGDALVEALAAFKYHARLPANVNRSSRVTMPSAVYHQIVAALASAYVNDSHTPDNGARAA
jgi:hypothetical protein